MKIIEGFPAAKRALSRQKPIQESPGVSENEQTVKGIIDDVRRRGDAALFEYTEKFDGARLTSLAVNKRQISSAYRKVDAELVSALKLAAGRIRSFHAAQKKAIWHELKQPGLSQAIRPLERAGVYVPGGRAFYPSTVLMTAIPGKVAGVKEIIMTTPPRRDGTIHPLTLVAADIAEVDRVFAVGGAQAIAALAYGTDTIPQVDKICGPGNIFVMLAKKAVYGTVAIDGLQGPSEVMIIADETTNPEYCAADLLAQAEHDPLASAILVTTSRRQADEVKRAVKRQLDSLPRQSIATESLESGGLIAVVASLDEAIELANLFAPEHLCLMVDEAASYVNRVRNAGCIVIGKNATVVLGDYVAGPSHALPTEGTARFSSPLNVADFIKFINVISLDETDLKKLGPVAMALARAEGLEAHARAVEKRLKA